MGNYKSCPRTRRTIRSSLKGLITILPNIKAAHKAAKKSGLVDVGNESLRWHVGISVVGCATM